MTLSRWRSPQAVAGALVALAAGVLVLYPVAFLLQAALNTGDPEARPPTKYGLDNFAGLLEYPQIILNTLTVSVAATVTVSVLRMICGYSSRPAKLSSPYFVGGRASGSPVLSAACSRNATG